MVGLSTAWFLQDRGVEVTVVDREGVAAGSARGNAGWLTPSLSTPLPDPAVLEYGIRAVLSPASPVYVPPTLQLDLVRFAVSFARHSTARRWRRSMRALAPVNRLSLAAFNALRDGGVTGETYAAEPFLAAYRREEERRVLVEELQHVAEAGQDVELDLLTGEEARRLEPALSEARTTRSRASRRPNLRRCCARRSRSARPGMRWRPSRGSSRSTPWPTVAPR